jgi:hypothetical protein
MDITPKTIVADLLNKFPELENKLIEIAPVFVKLRNPVLRRTIAKVTTLKQAALVGNIAVSELVNILRSEAGQDKINIKEEMQNQQIPEWIRSGNPIKYDACEDIEQGGHPLAKVMQDTLHLSDGEVYLLITPFLPAPLIDKLKDKGFEFYSHAEGLKYFNYFRKGSEGKS